MLGIAELIKRIRIKLWREIATERQLTGNKLIIIKGNLRRIEDWIKKSVRINVLKK